MGNELLEKGGREGGRERKTYLDDRNGKTSGGEPVKSRLHVFDRAAGFRLVTHWIEAWREGGREEEREEGEG